MRAEPVERRHATVMAPVLADPRIHEFLNGEIETEAELARRYEFMEGGRSTDGRYVSLTWILFLHGGEAIGFVEATVDEPELFYIAYVLNPTYWRQGYAREACVALLALLFEQFDVPKAVIEMDAPNIASIALAESLGFRYVTTVYEPEQRHPEHVYELTRNRWQQSTH